MYTYIFIINNYISVFFISNSSNTRTIQNFGLLGFEPSYSSSQTKRLTNPAPTRFLKGSFTVCKKKKKKKLHCILLCSLCASYPVIFYLVKKFSRDMASKLVLALACYYFLLLSFYYEVCELLRSKNKK